jgi:hypothetical protein
MTPPEALREHAHEAGDGRWWFSNPLFTHTKAEALQIAEACLILGVPVNDTLTSRAWLALLRKVVRLETRVEQLEKGHRYASRKAQEG